MGYPLLAHFDAPTVEARSRMVDRLLDAAPAAAKVSVTTSRPRLGHWEDETVTKREDIPSSERGEIAQLVRTQRSGELFAEVSVWHEPDEGDCFMTFLVMNPLAPPLRPAHVEIPHDVELDLKAWVKPLEPPPAGLSPQEHFSLSSQLYMLDLAHALCTVEGVQRGYVFVEQRVFVPLSYRLMFHARPAQFADDLRNVVELALRGGAAYKDRDSREHYDPLIRQGVASIDFCDRSRQEVAELRARIERALPALDARGVPDAVPEDLVREAAARSGRYAVFDDGRGGLGVRGLAPKLPQPGRNYDQMPVAFLDEFYLDLAELVLGR